MVTENGEYAIETFSLTKIFPDWWGRAKVIAVDGLDLKIRHNEIYGLLGPNGSGKTTTLKVLLNLLYPTKGKTLVLGGDTRDPKITARIGYLPEDSYLYRYLTARETLDFYGRIFGLPRKVRRARIDTLLEMVGLTGMANRAVGTYSKGMARRIGLAQALINDPDLLILDEPTSGMDPIGTRQMKDLFIELAKRGKTILLCSHLLADVEDICDRIGILYGGRMQVEGRVESLLRHSDEKQIVTGAISDSAIAEIKRIIHAEEQDCEITSPMVKLEEFFIQTVTTAQKEKQPTSGAVSTTEIGGFLTEQPAEANVLDELVSASLPDSSDSSLGVTETTETTPVQDKAEPQEDTDLLEKLTKEKPKDLQTDIVEKIEEIETDNTAEQVKRDVLDKLRDRSGTDGDTEPTRPDQFGEHNDA